MMKDEIIYLQIELTCVNILNDFDIVEYCTFILHD